MKLSATLHGVALVPHGEQVARPGHVDDRLHRARLVGERADVPARRGPGGAQERHEVAAGALAPRADLGGVDVEAVGVGPQVADRALHVDDLVGPVLARPEPVVEAHDDEPPLGQRRADAVDDEAAGVVVARDPGAPVDVDRRRGRAVQGGRLGDQGLLVVAVLDRGLAARPQGRGRRRRRHGAAALPGRGRAGAGAGGQQREAEQADDPGSDASAHGRQCWRIEADGRSTPRPVGTSGTGSDSASELPPYAQRRDRRRRPYPGGPPRGPPLRMARHRPGRPAAGRPAGPQRPGPLGWWRT